MERNWCEKFRETLENISTDLKDIKEGLSGSWEIWEVIKTIDEMTEYIDELLDEYDGKGDEDE